MSETLQANIHLSLSALLQNVVSDGVGQFQMNESGFVSGGLVSGSGADQGQQLYDELTTLASGNALTISMRDFGGASDQLGQIRSMTAVRMLAIQSMGNLNCTFVQTQIAILSGGSGYQINDVVTVAGGIGTAAKFTVTGIGIGNSVTGIGVTPFQGYTGGSYSVAPSTTNNPTGGSGTGLSLTLQLGTYDNINANLHKAPVFVDGDALTIGGDGTTGSWTSLLGTNTDKYIVPSGTPNLPGTLFLCGGGATAWVVGASSTNKNLKIANTGANPVTFRLIVLGS